MTSTKGTATSSPSQWLHPVSRARCTLFHTSPLKKAKVPKQTAKGMVPSIHGRTKVKGFNQDRATVAALVLGTKAMVITSTADFPSASKAMFRW